MSKTTTRIIMVCVVVFVGLHLFALAACIFLFGDENYALWRWVINDLSVPCEDYEVNSISDYGYFPGRNEDVEEYTQEYIYKVFPKEISPTWSNVDFAFHSHSCGIAFEAYLEFTIEDAEEFDKFISSTTEGMLSQPFYFDDRFQEYIWTEPAKYIADEIVIYDKITLSAELQEHDDINGYTITDGVIAKVLVYPEEKRVAFVAICVEYGAHANTAQLHAYFDRFNIDAKEYEAYTERYDTLNN